MKTLRLIKTLHGYGVRAIDGEIGKIDEFYFDDRSWKIRYAVVDLGGWILGRKVLLPPTAFNRLEWRDHTLSVLVTKAQVEESPDIDTDMPITRQYEMRLHTHYGWEFYLGGEVIANPGAIEVEDLKSNKDGKAFDPHLLSTRFLTGKKVEGLGFHLGKIHDFALDDERWTIPFIIVALEHHQEILVEPSLVSGVDVRAESVFANIAESAVERLPGFDTSGPILVVEEPEMMVTEAVSR